jgi:hypothetical protein
MDHAKTTTGQYLSVEEIREISRMMGELRDVTLSCRTFDSAGVFLERFTGEKQSARVYVGLSEIVVPPPYPPPYDPG